MDRRALHPALENHSWSLRRFLTSCALIPFVAWVSSVRVFSGPSSRCSLLLFLLIIIVRHVQNDGWSSVPGGSKHGRITAAWRSDALHSKRVSSRKSSCVARPHFASCFDVVASFSSSFLALLREGFGIWEPLRWPRRYGFGTLRNQS
jgi:hypothetical protein